MVLKVKIKTDLSSSSVKEPLQCNGPVYTVNIPLQCRRDCFYIKTEHSQVSTIAML